MKALILCSLSYVSINANSKVLETPLPGTVRRSQGNLENGIGGEISPENRKFLEEQLEHLKAFRPALQAAEKEAHVEINNPVIGVLKLPVPADLEQRLDFTPTHYIEASHVKFLESAGARVVPVDLDMHPKELMILMKKLNGVYIPGDYNLLDHPEFSRTVSEIVQHAQVFNEMEGNHFPIAAFGYGAISLL